MPQQFNFSPNFVLEAITARHFTVPQYQRSYSWSEQELEDFWLDMERAIADGGDYFLGSFVLSHEGNSDEFSIIDGQQRIATTTILLAAMRDVYRANGETDLANSFDTQFLRQHDVETNEYRRRLKLNAVDDPFYLERIIDGKNTPAEKESHKRLAFAALFFAKKVTEVVAANPADLKNQLAKITSYLRKQARVVVVQTDSDADAFTIFETLNDRGADLTIADLLKNYLFSRAKGELAAVQQYWLEAVAVLESDIGEHDYVGFLRQLWSSFHGVTRERELYRQIKAKVQTPQDALAFAKQIRDGAQLYRAILSPDDDYWSGFDKATREHVARLMSFNLQQNRPLLLAILSSDDRANIARILRNLVAWSVRGIVAGNQGGGQVEKFFCQAAVDFRKGSVRTPEQILAAVQPVVPTDPVFRAGFSVLRVPKNAQARYYLCAIEKSLAEEPEPEMVLNEDARMVNLEHILPQRRALGEWTAFTDDEASAYAYRLGNMTLLRRPDNLKVGNGEWPAKQGVLVKSQLKLNREISGVSVWDKDAIDVRQAELSDRAISVWPLLS